jgi:hypothetical protein
MPRFQADRGDLPIIVAAMTPGSTTFERNGKALAQRDPEMAARLRGVEPAALSWQQSKTGEWAATLHENGRKLSLASRYDPGKEADRLIRDIDPTETACVAVLGFGLGYHVERIHRQFGETGLLIIYEPDVALLRAVLEQLDYSGLLAAANVMVVDDAVSRAALTARLERFGPVLTQGTQLLEHPPSRQRQREAFRQFGRMVTEVLAYCRTNVATALVNSARTCRNLAMNLDHYAAGQTIEPLKDAAAGYPAVCVSAGPSLVKNADLLADPAVREKVVVIAVQTALRPLLARGIYPDFITALDYSQISRRFYEDLPELPNVTLVVEPKVHPTVVDHFPGPVRVARSSFNDNLLGELAPSITPIQAGATVAHLSFYLAQYLGCDPIMLTGQDLGFSDGLYYTPGTAVHQVWEGELNQFNTLEMMEWRRIMRMRGHLKRQRDIHGRSIFSDEQMLTYLKQFERDFAAASQTIIDATEGGMPKEGTVVMPLREALAQDAKEPVPTLPVEQNGLDPDRLVALKRLLGQRLEEVRQIRQSSQRSIPILREMKKHQDQPAKMNRLFERLNRHKRYVEHELGTAFRMVNELNSLGAFRRARADRVIQRAGDDEPERQAQQLERDIENLDWLTQACDEGIDILEAALQRVGERVSQLSMEAKAGANG